MTVSLLLKKKKKTVSQFFFFFKYFTHLHKMYTPFFCEKEVPNFNILLSLSYYLLYILIIGTYQFDMTFNF